MEALDLVPPSINDNLPAMVRHELVKLSPQKQEEFLEEYRRKAKSVAPAYILWLPLGWHYAYLGKWGIQILFWLALVGFFAWYAITKGYGNGCTKNFEGNIWLRFSG